MQPASKHPPAGIIHQPQPFLIEGIAQRIDRSGCLQFNQRFAARRKAHHAHAINPVCRLQVPFEALQGCIIGRLHPQPHPAHAVSTAKLAANFWPQVIDGSNGLIFQQARVRKQIAASERCNVNRISLPDGRVHQPIHITSGIFQPHPSKFLAGWPEPHNEQSLRWTAKIAAIEDKLGYQHIGNLIAVHQATPQHHMAALSLPGIQQDDIARCCLNPDIINGRFARTQPRPGFEPGGFRLMRLPHPGILQHRQQQHRR